MLRVLDFTAPAHLQSNRYHAAGQRESGSHNPLSMGEFVRSIPLFHGIRGEDLEQLEQQCKMQQFSDKQEILAEGVQSDHVWVIREGKVALVQTDRTTGKRTVGMILTQGD